MLLPLLLFVDRTDLEMLSIEPTSSSKVGEYPNTNMSFLYSYVYTEEMYQIMWSCYDYIVKKLKVE